MNEILKQTVLSVFSPLLPPPEPGSLQEAAGQSQPQQTQAQLYAAKYWHAFDQWILECIQWRDGEGPTGYQLELARSLITHKRVSARGPHGLGKTSFNAWLILWFSTTRDAAGSDWKLPTTAGAWRQLTKFLWPEVHKWARRLKWDIIGRPPFHMVHELQMLSLKLKTGEAFAVASDNPELIEGAHADQLCYIFDESKAIADATFDAAEGAFSNSGANEKTETYAAAMSTPGEPVGRFYDIHARKAGFEDWAVRYVTFDEVVAASRATWKWAEQRSKQWGEDSTLYKNKVLGQFASQDESGVIPSSWVEAAFERFRVLDEAGAFVDLDRLDAVGVDVGDQGDETVIARRLGNTIVKIDRYGKQGLMATTGKVHAIIARYGGQAIVDVIGIGAGVVSRLRELQDEEAPMVEAAEGPLGTVEYEVVPFHAAEASTQKDSSGEMGFLNKRAEAWWLMRERLDPSSPHGEVALVPDDKLLGDLVTPRYKVTSRGQYQIEGKPDIKKRLGRSTDTGDAVVMAFYENRSMPGIRRL